MLQRSNTETAASPAPARPVHVETLGGLLAWRATTHGPQMAFTFEEEDGTSVGITYAELNRRARAIAARLQSQAVAGQPVVLVFPAGLDFIAALFGCMVAGMPAAPASYPKPRRPMPRFESIVRDCAPPIALTNRSALDQIDRDRMDITIDWLAVDEVADEEADRFRPPALCGDDLALLQYTSGSTSDPKGVLVSHANLLANLEVIRQATGLHFPEPGAQPHQAVFWLPAYHDMGLGTGILTPIYVGAVSHLMAPTMFLQRPNRWLEAISRHRATVSGAPNFAYDLCVAKTGTDERQGLDLGAWRIAFCGAEPIRSRTFDIFVDAFAPVGFRRESLYPCYGLAEATLMVTGSDPARAPTLRAVDRRSLEAHRVVEASAGDESEAQDVVGCGRPQAGHEVAIVDPGTRRRAARDQVGEIWVRGPSVASGYWNHPDATREAFEARIEGEPDDRRYLRTGDLGFLSGGELFVTGRIKDLVIVRGRNLYPHDVEATAAAAHPAVDGRPGVAICVTFDERERLVVVQEASRRANEATLRAAAEAIRHRINEEYEVVPHAVVLVRQASVPFTTSGKVQRSICRQLYCEGRLKKLHELNGAAESGGAARERCAAAALRAALAGIGAESPLTTFEIDQLTVRLEEWIVDWVARETGTAGDQVDRFRPFAEYGLDSVTAVEMSLVIEEGTGLKMSAVEAWNHPNPAAMARHLAERLGGGADAEEEGAAAESVDRFEQLLSEIESEVEAPD